MLDRITLWMKNIAEENPAITAMFKAAKMQRQNSAFPIGFISSAARNRFLAAPACCLSQANLKARGPSAPRPGENRSSAEMTAASYVRSIGE
jgi:hypothetical protein